MVTLSLALFRKRFHYLIDRYLYVSRNNLLGNWIRIYGNRLLTITSTDAVSRSAE